MAKSIELLALLLVVEFSLFSCSADNSVTQENESPIIDATSSENTTSPSPISTGTSNNIGPAISKLDGRWVSNCVVRDPQNQAWSEQEVLVVEGARYERTINYYQDASCSIPKDISFLIVRSVGLQYPGGTVETVRGSASQIVVTSPMIEFDRRLLNEDEAALFDPALYFYDFYLFDTDGRLHFGSMNTSPVDQFEQSLDSPHIFTAE